jgi:hypothetical protein
MLISTVWVPKDVVSSSGHVNGSTDHSKEYVRKSRDKIGNIYEDAEFQQEREIGMFIYYI